MCLNCGCDLPYEDWDNPDNITVDTIKKATTTPKAQGLTADQVMNRITNTWAKVKPEDKHYHSGHTHVHSIGDIIDTLMDKGMNKQKAVKQADLPSEKYNGKMNAINKKASNY